MRRLGIALAAMGLLLAVAAAPASAQFGFSKLSVRFTDAEGNPVTQAGAHPFAMTTSFEVNSKEIEGKLFVDGALRNLEVVLPPGFAGNPTAVSTCDTVQFLARTCPNASVLGLVTVRAAGGIGIIADETLPVYNLQPSPGVAQKQGFIIQEVPVTVNAIPSPTSPYNVIASLSNTSQVLEVFSSELTLWGNPADERHDSLRGSCLKPDGTSSGKCPAGVAGKPFITLPRSCSGPLITKFIATSWWSGDPANPGPPAHFEGQAQSDALSGCSELGFAPHLTVTPSTDSADSPSGLEADLEVNDEELNNPEGRVGSDIQKAVITLPQGITANPSLAEGLAACSPADLARETLDSAPGEGCPEASKIGTVQATTPILEGTVLEGSLYIATPYENPFNSLLALYMVVREPRLGVFVAQAGEIEPDPLTGRLRTTFDSLPPFPLGHVAVRLRSGGRSPLVSPPGCGSFTSEATLTPSGNPASSFPSPSNFQISRGVGGGPCPPAGTPPFEPGLEAGTVSNSAGSYSPFYLRLTRRDGDQDLTRFDATLPPGLLAKLAGVERCSDAAIAAAKTKTGREELASPSCPANSQIGRVEGGAGVGSQLTYVPGKLYLAGPLGGAPLSVVGIVPAVAGPFDVGTIVVRQALRVNPKTAVGEIDGAASDPIPHILAGIPLRVRDIRVYVDRPQFTLNPTNCDPFATTAQIWGGGGNPFSRLDDAPHAREARFQAANCSRLGYNPKVTISLRGPTDRGGHPALTGVYKPTPGDANAAGLIARLPHSAFLDQAHIRTICTRVQFAADACPAGAIYGQATAYTPLLDAPLTGPVYLRSSSHKLPDLVLDLHGLVDVEVSARIDSVKGGIRASFEDVPDAPLNKVVLSMRGGSKGLVINSRDLCANPSRAKLTLSAQNGDRLVRHPAVTPLGCSSSRKNQRHHTR
jgi:hypothetical protein